jgi:O-antigen/teichoic acid export membrane protein
LSGVLLVPLYLKTIHVDLYGAWLASGNILAWLTMADPGISTVLQQRVATSYGGNDIKAIGQWMVNGTRITLVVCSGILLVGTACSLFIVEWLHLPPAYDWASLESAFRWSVLGTALMVGSFTVIAANQGLQGSISVGAIFIAASLARLITIVVMLRLDFGLLALAVPNALFGAILLCGNLWYLWIRVVRERIPIEWREVSRREMTSALSWSSLGRLAGVLSGNLDLFLVARLLGPENVSHLRLSRTAMDLGRMFVERPMEAIRPALAHLIGEGVESRSRAVATKLLRFGLVSAAGVGGGILGFNESFLRLWVGSQFFVGTNINTVLVAAFVLSTTTAVLGALTFSHGSIKANSVAGIAQGVVYVGMLWVLGHKWGLLGVVMASPFAIAATSTWVLVWDFKRSFSIESRDAKNLTAVAAWGVAVAVGLALLASQCTITSWAKLALYALMYSLAFALAVLIGSPALRTDVLQVFHRVKTSLGGTPSIP